MTYIKLEITIEKYIQAFYKSPYSLFANPVNIYDAKIKEENGKHYLYFRKEKK